MNNHKKIKNWYFFAKKVSQVLVKIKCEHLDQKSLTSPPAVILKFLTPTPNLT